MGDEKGTECDGVGEKSENSQKEKAHAVNILPHITYRNLITETVLGYQFWSLFLGLAPLIWFYPLNELEISGYESFAVVLFSPTLLAIHPLRNLLMGDHAWPIALLRFITAASLASFRVATTLQRLVLLCAGCFAVMLVLTSTLCHRSPRQRTLSCWGLLLGLFAMISSRIWFISFLPTWWDENSNMIVIALATVATCDKIASGDDVAPAISISPVRRPNWMLTAVGFGSLIYVTQLLFSEMSLLSRWTVAGYPDTGPMPYSSGIAVLLSLWFGIALSPCHHVTDSVQWWMIGAISLAGLYYMNRWTAFTCGLLFAVYVTSVWPAMLDRMSLCPPVGTLSVAMLTYLVEIMFSVWTVAYNFVPGGIYTREHTDLLLLFVAISLGLALPAFRKSAEHKSFTAFVEIDGKKMPNGRVEKLLLLFVLAGLGGFMSRFNAQYISPPPKVQPKADFTAAIWTYHFGYDNVGWPSLERTAQLLTDTGADVITLLEGDASKPFLGNNDLGMWLSEKLGMYVDFGVSTRDHTWGNLILSKYPIVRSVHHKLPSPQGELAPAITATINMTGHLVDFVTTHMGNDVDVLDRRLQTQFLSDELRKAENPVVFLGYVTSAPDGKNYDHFMKHGNVNDIDSTDKDRWCEYIFYRGLIRLGYARISHGGLSDTELQMARFRIPSNLTHFTDRKRMVKAGDNRLDKDVLFTSRFDTFHYGHNWMSDHQYHMSTPKYFI